MKNLDHGDVITIEGVRYYVESECDWPCHKCQLPHHLCSKYFGNKGPYDCATHSVTIKTAESVIAKLREEIADNEALIKRLEGK